MRLSASVLSSLSWALSSSQIASAAVLAARANDTQCRRTTVAVLGAGVAGITAAQALSNQSISDFVIIDRNDYVGGRVAHATFGKKPDGSPYVVELG